VDSYLPFSNVLLEAIGHPSHKDTNFRNPHDQITNEHILPEPEHVRVLIYEIYDMQQIVKLLSSQLDAFHLKET
jgi:hypothetical protein